MVRDVATRLRCRTGRSREGNACPTPRPPSTPPSSSSSARPATWPSAWCCRRSSGSPRRASCPPEWRLIGSGRREKTDDEFRDDVRDALTSSAPKPEEGPWDEFSSRLAFAGGGFSPDDPGQLLDRLGEAARRSGGTSSSSTTSACRPPPSRPTPARSGATASPRARGWSTRSRSAPRSRLPRARQRVHEVLDESQVFRIDHFLGKEATQELRALRFANGLFGSSWDRHHVAAVQIDVPETLDVADRAAVLRRDRRGARHARHPPVPGGRRGRDGAAGQPLAPTTSPQARADAVRAFRPARRPDEVVRGQFEGYRDIDARRRRLAHRDLRRRPAVDRHRPLARRAVPACAPASGWPRATRRSTSSSATPTYGAGDRRGAAEAGQRAVLRPLRRRRAGALDERQDARAPRSTWARRGPRLPLDSLSGGDPLPPYVRLIHDVLVGDRTLFTRPDGLEEVWHAAGAAMDDQRASRSPTRPAPGGPTPRSASPSPSAGCCRADHRDSGGPDLRQDGRARIAK